MRGNCFKCVKGVLGQDGKVWCSQDKCEYEFGQPVLYRPDTIKKKRGKQWRTNQRKSRLRKCTIALIADFQSKLPRIRCSWSAK